MSSPSKLEARKEKKPQVYLTNKTTVLRQKLAQLKKDNKTSSIPEELLYYIFMYLNASDLLQCMFVNKNWNRCASDNNLWKNLFKDLPIATQKLSLDAKRPKEVDWKEQVISCSIKRRTLKINNMIDKYEKKKLMLTKKTTSICDIIKDVDSKWHLKIQDENGRYSLIKRSNVSYFADALTIRWDVSLSQTINHSTNISIIAATPIFYDKNFKTLKGSTKTKSLIQSFTIQEQLAASSLLGSDEHVVLHGHKNIIIATWKKSKANGSNKQANASFIIVNFHAHNIIQRIFNGSPDQAYKPIDHVPVVDDCAVRYGLIGYVVNLELRNTKGSLWRYLNHELVKGDVFDNQLVFVVTKSNGIDIFHHSFDFPWQTGSLFGKVKGVSILDVTMTDINQEAIIAESVPVKVEYETQSTVNYNAGDDTLAECRVVWLKKGVCCVEMQLLKEDDNKVVVTELIFKLDIPFINKWFGVNY